MRGCGQDTTGDGTIDTHLTSVQAQTLHERASTAAGEQRKAQFQVRNPSRGFALACFVRSLDPITTRRPAPACCFVRWSLPPISPPQQRQLPPERVVLWLA